MPENEVVGPDGSMVANADGRKEGIGNAIVPQVAYELLRMILAGGMNDE